MAAAPGTICACNDIALQHCIYGTNTQYPDIANARCIVVDGRNYPTATPLHWHIITERKRRGEEVYLIVLDPRCTITAKNADYWLQLRPGTDAGVFLAWLYIMLRDNLYDKRFVERWSNGPLLLRTDKDWWLTEKDIVKEGKDDRYVAWDRERKVPIIWDPVAQQFYRLSGEPIPYGEVNVALEGYFELETVEGQKVECKTAFIAFKERIMEYPPEKMAEITWVPKKLLEESARLLLQQSPVAFIEA